MYPLVSSNMAENPLSMEFRWSIFQHAMFDFQMVFFCSVGNLISSQLKDSYVSGRFRPPTRRLFLQQRLKVIHVKIMGHSILHMVIFFVVKVTKTNWRRMALPGYMNFDQPFSEVSNQFMGVSRNHPGFSLGIFFQKQHP